MALRSRTSRAIVTIFVIAFFGTVFMLSSESSLGWRDEQQEGKEEEGNENLSSYSSSSKHLMRVGEEMGTEKENKISRFSMEDEGKKRELEELEELVIVAGHSIFVGLDYNSFSQEGEWVLESYQKGQLKTYLEHIQSGVEMALKNPKTLLVFSGGETRKSAGPRSEAQSYWLAAEANGWFTDTQARMNVKFRVTTEEFARDSLENLMFSICRFREITGHYPLKVTVVGFEFKRKRFEDLHRAALKIPKSSFNYVGIDPYFEEHEAKAEKERLMKGELENSLLPFTSDPYGCGESLTRKRESRNPFYRSIGYPSGCPEMASLMKFCGKDVYQGTVPWD